MNTWRVEISLLIVLVLVLVVSGCGEKEKMDYQWKEGFLEKDYAASQEELSKALDNVFLKCVAVRTTMLEEQKGTIVSWGVGDKSGKWRAFNGVSTIKELNIKDGGVVIAVKTVHNDKAVSVGVKVGDGDRESSQILHKLLLTELVGEANA